MQVYFDESGDFRLVAPGVEKFCFVVGVIVPEISTVELKADFDLFIRQLNKEEFVAGDAKGSALSRDHRKLLLDILKKHRNVMIVPITLNLGCSGGPFFAEAPRKIRSLIESRRWRNVSTGKLSRFAKIVEVPPFANMTVSGLLAAPANRIRSSGCTHIKRTSAA